MRSALKNENEEFVKKLSIALKGSNKRTWVYLMKDDEGTTYSLANQWITSIVIEPRGRIDRARIN